MADHKNATWRMADNPDGTVDIERVQAHLLMDIRDRLDVLQCWEFRGLPRVVREILSRLRTKPVSKRERLERNAERHRRATRRRRR